MDIGQCLGEIALFKGLPDDQLSDLASIALVKRYHRASTIFSEGEPGSGFYVLLAGRVKIFKLSPDGKEQILHIFGPGEPFGEVPVFEGKSFPAHAETLENSTAVYFPRTEFVSLIKRNPSLALNMLAVLSRRLRTFTVLVDNLSLKEVPGRLSAHLLYLSQHNQGAEDVELDISKGQLASVLGTIPETLSRILARMSKQGYIESDGRRIRILDRTALEELAEGIRRL
jgi:CRP/FNR family transcriptional regulator